MNIEREVQILNINDILPNRFQPRITFDEKAIMELAESIKTHGVIQPIVVRKVADKYEIIAGERRYKASIIAGKTTIPAIVTDLDDKDSAEVALIENVQRQDLTPIEEAISYKKILDMGYLNQSELATKLGKTQSTIANKLRLLNLTDEVQEALLKEKISERHARSLLKLDKSKQNEMLNRIITERMTVRKTDEEIAKITNNVEMLDFGKKEDVSMNNQINSSNIPTSPIIEPNPMNNVPNVPNVSQDLNVDNMVPEPNIEPFNIDTLSTNDNLQTVPTSNSYLDEIPTTETINPGFMDINKIEAEATNINPTMGNSGSFINNEPNQNLDSIINQPTYTTPIDQPNDNGQPAGGRFFSNQIEEPNQPQDNNLDNMFDSNNIFTQDMNFNQPQFDQPYQNQTNNANNNAGFNPALASFNLGSQPQFDAPQPEPAPQNINTSVVELGGTGFMNEEPILQPLMNNNEPVVRHDMKEAISIIRSCSKQIENLGFKLDVEEIDFENFYQATFKIEKP